MKDTHPAMQEAGKDWSNILETYEETQNGNYATVEGEKYNTSAVGRNPAIAELYKVKDDEVIMTAMQYEAIYDDSWMFYPCWGVQRAGKTTVQLQLGYKAYYSHHLTTEQVWERVLDSVVANLTGFMYKVANGKPCLVDTNNGFHKRVPYILWDDWGGESNKAETRHKQEFDMFKGAIDMYATKVAILSASMVTPDEPTNQLINKYTHELFLPRRGVYKLDKILWTQDFYGFQSKRRKIWVETETFDHVPLYVYKRYDEIRQQRVDELQQKIMDMQMEGVDRVVKRTTEEMVDLLLLIFKKGPLPRGTFDNPKYGDKYKKYHEALINCRARDLLTMCHVPSQENFGKPNPSKAGAYSYDITNMGLEVLKHFKGADMKQKESMMDLVKERNPAEVDLSAM
jgi:hypothetical protein